FGVGEGIRDRCGRGARGRSVRSLRPQSRRALVFGRQRTRDPRLREGRFRSRRTAGGAIMEGRRVGRSCRDVGDARTLRRIAGRRRPATTPGAMTVHLFVTLWSKPSTWAFMV